jgi:hypothetical protein
VRRVLILVVMLGATACSPSAKQSASTTAPAPTTTSTTVPATTTTEVGGCPLPDRAAPNSKRSRYVIRAEVLPAEHRVRGDLTVRFTPDLATDRLVFRLWPNGPRLASQGAKLTVSNVAVGAHQATANQPDATSLVLPLNAVAGQTIEASLAWDLRLPGPNNDRIAQIGDSIRLGSFFPILAWEPGVGWATEPAVSGFAEASTAPVADFDLSLTVPPGLDVLASGVPDSGRTRWHAEAMRDIAVSIGHFRVAERDAAGVHITVGVAADVAESPDTYANKIATRLEQFSTWFGAYAWPVYTMAVTPSLRGGIEYPTHVMQGPGTIGRTTTHELAHQWFYGLVGDDQGRDPWLDEGLASYAEGRAEGNLKQLQDTVVPLEGQGHMASPMSYWDAHQSAYYRGVYAQGARAVASLGPVDRVDCALRVYVARNAYRIARPADLLAAATVVFGDAREKLAAYGVTSAP